MRLDPKSPLAARATSSVIRPAGSGLVVGEAAGGPQFVAKRNALIDQAISAATVNTTNKREHRAVRAKRTNSVRRAMYRRAKAMLEASPIGPLLVVTVTRVAPRKLDAHDNLRAALKPHVDGIADALRIDDASPLVRWDYAQRRGPEAVEISWSEVRP